MSEQSGVVEKLDLTPDKKGVETTHVIRYDKSVVIHEETPVRLSGIIDAPAEFYSKRKASGQFTKDNSIVTFSRSALKIVLTLRERDHFKDQIIGQLKRHKFLAGLLINSDSGYSIGGLKKAFERNRMWFKDPSDHSAMMKGLRNFSTKIETAVKEENDRQGTAKKEISMQLKEGVEAFQLSFTLFAPIFEGMEKVDIHLTTEIDFNQATKDIQLFLINDDFDLIVDQIIDQVWSDQQSIFKDLPIINID